VITPLLFCLLVLLALGGFERLARDRAWRDVPIRIHVNGTRGKSTVTRLVWSALREAGVPTLGKTTGTAARLLLPDGAERDVVRRGPASIREQLALLRLARHHGARAVVVECMALDPTLQYVSERAIVRATIGVITNVRLDHTELMGHDLQTIASTLANTIPVHAVLVHGEPLFDPLFRARAAAVGTRVTAAGLAGGKGWFEEDVATALAVTRELGIADDVARTGFQRAPLDPGTARDGVLSLRNGESHWLNATAANDPTSLAVLVDGVSATDQPRGSAPRPPLVLIYNHRADRAPRLDCFARESRDFRDADLLIITGSRPPRTVWRRLSAARGGRAPDFVPPRQLAHWLHARASGCSLVFCGNTRGLDVPRVLEEASSRG
jgi:poly-gamma-glutamate synthase PgsB/CapB